MTSEEQEILGRITKKSAAYCSLATQIHHKDGDLHFTVTFYWDYGREPYYQAEHYGYLHDPGDSPKRDNLAEALDDLEKILDDATSKQVSWSEKVLTEGPEKWDEEAMKDAKLIFETTKKTPGN